MRYLILGAVLLLLCLAVCLITLSVLRGCTDEAEALLRQAQANADAGMFRRAERLVEDAMDVWMKHSGFFGAVLRHDAMDSVVTAFRELLEYARNDCAEEFEPTCAALIEQLRHLVEIEQPSAGSILTALSA